MSAETITLTLDEYEHLFQCAYVDQLTGLGNRRAHDRALDALATANAAAYLMLDIDHFKAVNDQFGHDAGDTVLAEVADTIRSVIREDDRIEAHRYGGEEMVVLIRGCTEADAVAIAERIRSTVLSHSWPSVSIGVAWSDQPAEFANLRRLADERVYAAKHAGRNRVVSQ